MTKNTYEISNGQIWDLVVGVYCSSNIETKRMEFMNVFKTHQGKCLHADSGPSCDRICAHWCYLSLYQSNEEHKEEEPVGTAFCKPECMHINTYT